MSTDTDKYVGLSDLGKYHSRLMDSFADVEITDILKLFFEERPELFTIRYNDVILKNEVDKSSVTGNLMLPVELDGVTCGTLSFNLLDGTKVTGLFVPENYRGFSISKSAPIESAYIGSPAISSNAFSQSTYIKNVYLMDSVTSLYQNAFQSCSNLEKVRLPESISSIPTGAFRYCRGLKEINFPKRLISIGDEAFYSCLSLEHLELPEALRTIGTNAFRGLGAKEITIPNMVTGELNNTFVDSKLESVVIGNSVKSLSGTFSYSSYSSIDEKGPLQSVVIGSSVKSIGSYTFGNASLTSITIPANVTSIDSRAFAGCDYLTDIEVDDDNPNYSAENGILYNKDKSLMVSWPSASGDITISVNFEAGCFGGQNGGNRNITSISVLNDVTLPEYGFYGCTNMESVELPEGLTEISSNVFYGCTSLSDIEIPSTVTHIRNYAFADCTGLTEITIPEGCVQIGQYTFRGCTGLTSVRIPDSCTNIGNYASMSGNTFYGCTSLVTVHIGSGITDFNAGIFSRCSALESIYIHNTTPPRIRSISEINNVQNIYVPAEAVETYKENTYWSSVASKIQAISE